ncbi:MAG: 4Fe-4S ferredoxin [Crenarchaeota archaeon]|nr:4Fe-4S ferredoxin [Thermoproteota archaeon]MCR8454396.1 4Fe-4S ferredoxin [Thermoproteota archaeon]MCR8455481.1 4Fe-4S ferredoxin [Thermoproteota archaeon]MCR8463587.1 4Fe-4S ferredoxin [Thermoproteota archaeon]MCR8471940.1 4Fe-4S ferredoxin [Thermoproteota archaeon]
MPEILSLWVKAKILRGSHWLICSKCLKHVNPNLYSKLAEGKVVLEFCPEENGQLVYGKIASMIRSNKPNKITVVTIEGSPHCLTLQAAVNEAIYIVGEKVEKEHYVLVNGENLVKISPDAVRISRYLSLVDKLISKNPEILKELEKYSLEYQHARKTETEKVL